MSTGTDPAPSTIYDGITFGRLPSDPIARILREAEQMRERMKPFWSDIPTEIQDVDYTLARIAWMARELVAQREERS